MRKLDDLKVAIVCDWLTGIGGAERVVLELHRMFPEAPIYTSQYNPAAIDWFKDADVQTTWLQKLPKSLKKFLPVLRAWTFSHLDLSGYDLVISSSGAEAKGIKVSKNTLHVNYCHSPTHYYWSRYEQYMHRPGFGFFDPLARIGLKLLAEPMRRWDYRAAQSPDVIIANSTHTQAEIKKYYGRDSTVIHPPVDTERFLPTTNYNPEQSRKDSQLPTPPRRGLVAAGRQTPYKRLDLAVAACTQLGLPLTVIGNGPDHQKLRKMAGPTITFITDATDQDIPRYFAAAEAFIFPGTDDFGIVAVEAMAAGTPVIAYKKGGTLDYVMPGKTGLFFNQQTAESLTTTLKTFHQAQFDAHKIQHQAQKFNTAAFRHNLTLLFLSLINDSNNPSTTLK